MKNNDRRLLLFLFIFAVNVTPFYAYSQNNPISASETQAKQSIEYLLSIDRLHFYIQNLADFLDGKKSPEVIESLRNISPEDIYDLQLKQSDLDNPSQWQTLVFNIVLKKSKAASVNFADLEWNYNFFKNKLMGRFTLKDIKSTKDGAINFASKEEAPRYRSVPKIQGTKYLLDVERYIAEKTSRAIIWDAIVNDRDFEFYIGTQRDFQDVVARNNIKIVSEIRPMAQNYNKIFLSFNEKTGRFSYIMNLISGEDRIKHLIAQLRLIRFKGKSYLTSARDKVRIFGNASVFHQKQTNALLEVYNRLPKADKVIIGQKGAIDDAIRSAGMLDVVSKNAPEILEGLNLEKTKKSKFENLTKNANEMSAFLLDAMNPGPVKVDTAYEIAKDPFDRIYKQFTSDQPSHEFSDYLLEDNQGTLKR